MLAIPAGATASLLGGGNVFRSESTSTPPGLAPTITLAPSTLPSATVGTAYSQQITAGGGTAPYTFAVTAGALPAGVTLNSSGQLSGTPTAGGTFTFTVTATDSSAGPGPYSGGRTYSLSVQQPTIAIAPAALPSATTGTAYSQQLTAGGGTAPYTFAVTAGALPPGVTLNSSGSLSGTPTTTGTFTFKVTATDSSTGSGPYSGGRSYTLQVQQPTITLNPASLPKAAAGFAYSQQLTASGGRAPYSYAVTAGALPAGVTLSTSGQLSGTPTTIGSFTFTVTATDSSPNPGPFTGGRTYTLTVGTNQSPSAIADTDTLDEDVTSSGKSVLANDTDADGDLLTAVLVAGPSHAASFDLKSDGTYTYTPTTNYNGEDSFTYKANDGKGDSAVTKVSITVNPVDDAPVAIDDSVTVLQDSAEAQLDVLANDTDVDGGPLGITALRAPAHGTATIARDRSHAGYEPARGYCGTDSFTYTLNGGTSATVSVTVACATTPRDTVAPALKFGVAKKQKLSRAGAYKVKLSCNEDCTVTLGASIKPPGRGARTRRSSRVIRLKAGKPKTVKLAIPKAGMAAVRKAIKGGKPVTVKLTATARDTDGNAGKAVKAKTKLRR